MEWKLAESVAGKTMADTLLAHNPDIICVTEGHLNQMPGDWHVCPSEADHGYRPIIAARRKVLLFSRIPWSDIDSIGSPSLPSGRFVEATTKTALGPMRCVGVCVPWAGAHVKSGARNRATWEDHRQYLRSLRPILERLPNDALILGDFNQRVPRKSGPRDVAELLMSALGVRFRIVTSGIVPDVGNLSIDHAACSASFITRIIRGLPASQGNLTLSDHFGLILRIERSAN